MRLIIVPGPVDKVHTKDCGHTRRAVEAGRATRIQGPRAERMLNLLATDPHADMVPSDGADNLPKGYFRACRVCQPTRRRLDPNKPIKVVRKRTNG